MPYWKYLLGVWALLLHASTASAAQFTVHATLAPRSASEWQIEYRISPPVDALVFMRGGDYRQSSWSADNDAFVIERFGSTDRIRRRDGAPFSIFSALVLPYTEKPSSGYTPFVRFSDGTLAAFTGQFTVVLPVSGNPEDFADGVANGNAIGPVRSTIAVHPGTFERIVANAEVSRETETLELGEGEYVYFGAADVVETEVMTAITDAATPNWLRSYLHDSMAKTFDYFSLRLGALRGERPFLISAFRELDGREVNLVGGVVESQVVVSLGIGEDIDNSAEVREFMARFFAHESAHLWHRGGGIPAGGPGSWVHEGSADALAWLALQRLDIYDDATTLGLFEDAANRCAQHLNDGPLTEAALRGAYVAHYDCGALIGLATHAIMRPIGRDLFDFWRRLLNSGAGADDFRVDYYYFQVGRVSPDLQNALLAFVENTHADSTEAVSDVLQTAGVDSAVDDDGTIRILSLP